MSEKLEILAGGLLPLLADIRRAQADATSDIRKTVSSHRLERWAEAIETFLENAGQGARSRGTIALEELSSEND
jgi:hypothetical protein